MELFIHSSENGGALPCMSRVVTFWLFWPVEGSNKPQAILEFINTNVQVYAKFLWWSQKHSTERALATVVWNSFILSSTNIMYRNSAVRTAEPSCKAGFFSFCLSSHMNKILQTQRLLFLPVLHLRAYIFTDYFNVVVNLFYISFSIL